MITKRFLLISAFWGAVAATQAFAGYTAPDSNVYTYKIVQWYKNVVQDATYEEFDGLDLVAYEHVVGVDSVNRYESGIAVYGASGLQDFAAARRSVSIWDVYDHGLYYYDSFRKFEIFTTSMNVTWERGYYNDNGYVNWNYLTGPTITSGSLGLSVPGDVVPGGTTTSGSGYITAISPAPADLVGVPDGGVIRTEGEQLWVMITWTNTAPGSLEKPEAPDWTDAEWTDPGIPDWDE